MQKPIIILGSERSQGNTSMLCNTLSDELKAPIIDLKTKRIEHFDYDFQNQDDDFPALIKEIIDNYDCLIFATPVYWYSMSGRMKIFFDRISDLLIKNKELGRKLKGKQIAVLSCGSDDELKEGFYMPFIESAKYLGMTYKGNVHGWITENSVTQEIEQKLKQFAEELAN